MLEQDRISRISTENTSKESKLILSQPEEQAQVIQLDPDSEQDRIIQDLIKTVQVEQTASKTDSSKSLEQKLQAIDLLLEHINNKDIHYEATTEDQAFLNLQDDLWDASTNTPAVEAIAETGYMYIVGKAGNSPLGGVSQWNVGDIIIKTEQSWISIKGSQEATDIYTAGETISAYSPVILQSGKIYGANSNLIAHAPIIIGVAEVASNADESITVFTEGNVIENNSWNFTPNKAIFLNGATLSHTPPSSGVYIELGFSLSTTSMKVKLSDPIIFG